MWLFPALSGSENAGNKVFKISEMSFKIDKQTLNDLAIFSMGRSLSVYEIFNRTRTRGGARLLEEMFMYPLSTIEEINSRGQIIGYT